MKPGNNQNFLKPRKNLEMTVILFLTLVHIILSLSVKYYQVALYFICNNKRLNEFVVFQKENLTVCNTFILNRSIFKI